MCFSKCEEHTDVNDPLLGGWLTRMPVIPKAELHFWALVVLKHSHHYCLWWRKKGDGKSRELATFVRLNVTLSPASISKNSPLKAFHLSLQIPPFSSRCHHLFAVSGCVFVYILILRFDKEKACHLCFKATLHLAPPCSLLFFPHSACVRSDKRRRAELLHSGLITPL